MLFLTAALLLVFTSVAVASRKVLLTRDNRDPRAGMFASTVRVARTESASDR